MISREATFPGSEGTVFYRAWEPGGPARRVVVVVHGYAEHSARYAHLAPSHLRRAVEDRKIANQWPTPKAVRRR